MSEAEKGNGSTRLPGWYIKAVWYALFAIFVAICIWYVASRLTDLMITVAICFFLAFAIEPTVNRLAARGWSRVRATLLVYVVGLAAIAVFLVLFGRLLIDQTVGLISAIPDLYEQLRTYLDTSFNVTIPEPDELMDTYLNDALTLVANNALGIASQLLIVIFGALTVLLVRSTSSRTGRDSVAPSARCSRHRPRPRSCGSGSWRSTRRRAIWSRARFWPASAVRSQPSS